LKYFKSEITNLDDKHPENKKKRSSKWKETYMNKNNEVNTVNKFDQVFRYQ